MKIHNHCVIVGSIMAGALLCSTAGALGAVFQFNVGADNYNPTLFFSRAGGWTSGGIALPAGTTISTTPIEIDLNLSHNLTTANASLGHEDYGFGLGGLNPQIQPGSELFTFSIELLENGVLITPNFAFDLAHPGTFGSTVMSPFTFAVDNAQFSASTHALNTDISFDQIDILVSNNSATEDVTSFSVLMGVLPVPEPGTRALCSLGLLGIIVFHRRRITA